MIKAAIINETGLILDMIILDDLSQCPGAVFCPDYLGIGANISDPQPIGQAQPIIVGAQTL